MALIYSQYNLRWPSYGQIYSVMEMKRIKESFFYIFEFADNGSFYQSYLPMQPFKRKFNGEYYSE